MDLKSWVLTKESERKEERGRESGKEREMYA